uniref:OSJNBa0032I19.12 protein n=1 Tax=Oryza sativa subsp. japonica TaxID=39947 RepID=Q7X7F5_ORYSJ|nr:OSJNBa0067G20.1 [Oryza sativa Japonica Group]CAE03318.2 OSJNBa0032I19.12 [Oryza sativa Japonica Group]
MEREAGGTNPQPVLGRMVVIEDYILCDFIPPPSEFLLLVLNFYGLSLLHLNPNSIAFLSIFSHLCEAYIGVEPFLDLFRFYYELRWMEPNRVSGCVGFRLRDGLKSRYIPFQCPSSRSKWRTRWFYLQIKDSDPVFIVPTEQPDKIPSWTAKPPLTPSLQSFIDIVDDLRVRGLSRYEVTADFVRRRIQPLQARVHPAFDYSGPEDATRVSPQGLNSETVGRRVGQVMISSPTTASNIPVPLCEKRAAERDAAINALPLTNIIGPLADHQVAASLKEKVAKEASDAAAATTSGGNVLRKGRKFSASDASPLPPRRQRLVTVGEKAARAKAVQDESGGTSGASPAAASTDVVLAPGSREVTPSGPVSDPAAGRGPLAAVLTWEDLQVEMGRLLEASARGIGRDGRSRDVDDEDVQQRGQPEFEPHASPDNVDQTLATGPEMVTTSLDLESALGGQDRRIQYWKTKFEVADLERTMLAVKKEQAVETLRGGEVWFNSYLKSCCTSMARVCRELRVPHGDPEESAAGYISWLNGACAQLDGVGKRIDEALKQECHRSSRYAGGHVLACLRDLREGFARSRRTPAEIDHLARSMAPFAEKIFQSMDWRWPSW